MDIRKAKAKDIDHILFFVTELKRSAYMEMDHPIPDDLLDTGSEAFLQNMNSLLR